MKKTYDSSTSKPQSLDNPQTFEDYSACIGYYALRNKYPEALSLINTALSKFKEKAERYEILCMAGDCQRNQKIWNEAESLFNIAKESSYEPVAARANLGLVECSLIKGNVGEAEKSVYSLIEGAKKAATLSAGDNVDSYTLGAVPMSAQAIAMQACSIFDRYGYRDKGTGFLDFAIGGDISGSPRTSAMLARRQEETDPKKAQAIYEQLLSGTKLGTREVDFLAGLLRVDPSIKTSKVDDYLAEFRPIAKPRAMFAALTAFRTLGRPEWITYATKVANPLNFSSKAKKWKDHVLAAEALKLLNKEAEVSKNWKMVEQISSRLLGTKFVSPRETVSAIKSIATAEVLQTGKVDEVKIANLCNEAKNQKSAKYGVARAMMQIEDYTLAEKYFQDILSDESIGSNWKSKARFNLAECYDKNGKPEQSLKMYEEFLQNPDLDQKFAVIAATKMISPMSKMGDSQDVIVPKIYALIDKTDDYVSLLDMARIIKQNKSLPKECYMKAYEKGRKLALGELDSAQTPEGAMKTIFLLGRRQRDLLLYKEFVEDYYKFAESRLGWLSRSSGPYWEYGAFAYEIMNNLDQSVQADTAWTNFLAGAEKKPSGVDLSHYHLFKGIINLNRGSEAAKGEFAKVIELAPLHVNASRAYYWLALVDRGNGDTKAASNYANRGLNATGVQGGYIWQQKLRKKLAILASEFDVEKAAPGKNQLESYQQVAGEVMQDLKKVEKLIG
jgi:tetratricopeptide (TPR) repeat protein